VPPVTNGESGHPRTPIEPQAWLPPFQSTPPTGPSAWVSPPGPVPPVPPRWPAPPADDRTMWYLPDGTVTFTRAPAPGVPTLLPWLPPRPRRRIGLRISLVLAALLVLCGTPAVWAVSRLDLSTLAEGTPGPGPAAPGPLPTGVRSPRPGDPPSVRTAWVSAQIDLALAGQAQALLSGDERAFVAAGEAGMATELKRRFGSLRAMQVTGWDPLMVNGPSESTGKGGRAEWKATLSLRHCFVVVDCQTDGLVVHSTWVEKDGRALLTALESSSASERGPRPWEVSELRAAVGARTVVATTARYSSRLSSLLSEAEKAALVADRFTVNGDKPDRYRIYFAGSDEWKKWFGGDRPQWTAGYAISISDRRMEVVLNASQVPTSFLDDILRHELTHVSSLRGARYQYSSNWWLSEGLADHALLYGQPASRHDALAAGVARRFLRAGKWDGKVAIAEPDDKAPLWEAVARYGIAFLGVRRMAERFGEAKLLAFFGQIMHRGSTLDNASQSAFGVPWSNVEGDCARSIRSRIG
jgi:hypothetical protein